MRLDFRALCRVRISHAYFDGAGTPGDAFAWLVTPATQAALAGAHALSRLRDGQWWVVQETDAGEQPRQSLAGQTLLVGLVLRDAAWPLYTAPLRLPAPPPGEAPLTALFANTADPLALDAPVGVRVCGRHPRLTPLSAQRPVRLVLVDAQDRQVADLLVAPGQSDARPAGALPEGHLRLEEHDPAGQALLATQQLYVAPDLAAEPLWGLLAIEVSAALEAAPDTEFTITLAARQDRLRYYVVARRYGENEFASLNLADVSPGGLQPPSLVFDRLAPEAFDPVQHLGSNLLDASGQARIALFEAQALTGRQARSARRIQLRRDDAVLVEQLPQPGASRAQADFIVHLDKP